MMALGLSNFSATKTICEKGSILSHLDFWVLHEENKSCGQSMQSACWTWLGRTMLFHFTLRFAPFSYHFIASYQCSGK